MNAIMMYMSGNSLQIFSIMMVFMLFKNPVQSLMQTNQAFTRFETEGTRKMLWLVKAAYVAMNLVALGLGVWKVNGMGLLPWVTCFSFTGAFWAMELMNSIGRRGRIGWLGKRRENH